MEYKEILGLYDHFQPVVDIKNEVEMYWKKFIPNDQFYNVLSTMLTSLDSNKPAERLPIWLQGTYGTGKSHATTVLKHLLYDDMNEINGYDIGNVQLKHRLNSFRDKKKVFPVILKGTSNIYDNRTFTLVIEKAVKDALKRAEIPIKTKTDFETVISKLKSDEINWEKIFKGTELEIYGTKEDIVAKLENDDITILRTIEDILSEKRISFHKEDITTWLEEVLKELKEQGKADYLTIYWDEFTGIFELPKFSIILTELQSIAELSIKGIFLFIVSHRRPYQTELAHDDVEKILGRFKVLEYYMETITTYHILNASIIKLNQNKWSRIKNKHVKQLKTLIKEIIGTEGTNIQKSLEDLFPIHPYTAYLATFIARNIGSAERSIFNFLYDEKNGFKKFIEENPGENGNIFLTVDYLWDFFYEDFDRYDDIKVISVVERYKLYADILEKEGIDYLKVFKGILILNILYKVAEVSETSLATPSETNIRKLFKVSISTQNLNKILKFINDKQIITKNPDNLYILTSTGLNQKEIENEKEKLRKTYKDINSIINSENLKEIQDSISKTVLRRSEIAILDNNLNEHLIKNKLDNLFKDSSNIHICLFLGRDNNSLNQIVDKLKRLSPEKEYENIIFAVSDRILEDSEFQQFLSYKASSIVAEKHNYDEEKLTNDEFSRRIINEWVENLQKRNLRWFFRYRSGNELMSQFGDKINKDFSIQIFYHGVERLNKTIKHQPLWNPVYSKKAIEIFLFANNREYIELKTVRGMERPLKEIIRDNNGEFIIDTDLKFKKDIDDNHPLKKMDLEIRNILEKGKNRNFNLGNDLKFLNASPYGLYHNMFNLGLFAFLMNSYIGKLYNTSTGIPIQKEDLRERIISLFKYWENGKGREKLNIRFGSAEEEKLIEILNSIFKLDDIKSLNDTRWRIRDWIKKNKIPIWIFKCAKENNVNSKKAIDSIFKLIKSIDSELNEEKIAQYLDDIELAKFELDLVLNKKNHMDMFQTWISNIEVIDIKSDECEEALNYIYRNMPEEIATWTEDKTKETLMLWLIEKNKKSEPTGTGSTVSTGSSSGGDDSVVSGGSDSSGTGSTVSAGSGSGGDDSVVSGGSDSSGTGSTVSGSTGSNDFQTILDQFTKKIESCDEIILKKAVINVINEKPELINLINKYLDV